MAKKFIYYLKGYSRTIVITDKDDSIPIEETVNKISRFMAGCKVSKFETENDILIVRPSDIIGVHIAKDSSKHDDYRRCEESTEEIIELQNIVPEIDLGDIESKEELEGIDELDKIIEKDNTDNINEEEIEEVVEELSDDNISESN